MLEIMKSLNGDKSSALDGTALAFLQNCWNVFKKTL